MDSVLDRDLISLGILASQQLEEFDAVVVSGPTGMLGGYLVEILCEYIRIRGAKTIVVGIVRKKNKYAQALARFYPKELRFLKESQLERELKNRSRILVVHAASPADPKDFVRDVEGLLDANIDQLRRLMNHLAKRGGHLVYLSSGEVYGFSPTEFLRENEFSGFDHLSDRGVYPEAKRIGEVLAVWGARRFNFGLSVLRLFHTFGPGIRWADSRIFSEVVRSAVASQPIVLRSPGNACRTFLYSGDMVTGLVAALVTDEVVVCNLAGQEQLTIRDFASIGVELGATGIEEMSRQSLSPSQASVPESPIGVAIPDLSVMRSLGWAPRVSVREALERTVASCKWRSFQGFLDT